MRPRAVRDPPPRAPLTLTDLTSQALLPSPASFRSMPCPSQCCYPLSLCLLLVAHLYGAVDRDPD